MRAAAVALLVLAGCLNAAHPPAAPQAPVRLDHAQAEYQVRGGDQRLRVELAPHRVWTDQGVPVAGVVMDVQDGAGQPGAVGVDGCGVPVWRWQPQREGGGPVFYLGANGALPGLPELLAALRAPDLPATGNATLRFGPLRLEVAREGTGWNAAWAGGQGPWHIEWRGGAEFPDSVDQWERIAWRNVGAPVACEPHPPDLDTAWTREGPDPVGWWFPYRALMTAIDADPSLTQLAKLKADHPDWYVRDAFLDSRPNGLVGQLLQATMHAQVDYAYGGALTGDVVSCDLANATEGEPRVTCQDGGVWTSTGAAPAFPGEFRVAHMASYAAMADRALEARPSRLLLAYEGGGLGATAILDGVGSPGLWWQASGHVLGLPVKDLGTWVASAD